MRNSLIKTDTIETPFIYFSVGVNRNFWNMKLKEEYSPIVKYSMSNFCQIYRDVYVGNYRERPSLKRIFNIIYSDESIPCRYKPKIFYLQPIDAERVTVRLFQAAITDEFVSILEYRIKEIEKDHRNFFRESEIKEYKLIYLLFREVVKNKGVSFSESVDNLFYYVIEKCY